MARILVAKWMQVPEHDSYPVVKAGAVRTLWMPNLGRRLGRIRSRPWLLRVSSGLPALTFFGSTSRRVACRG